MKKSRTKIQKGEKKFLSVILTVSMLIPSILNGTMAYTTYATDLFSDQSMVGDETEEFIDKTGEEDKKIVDTVEIPDVLNVFSDKGVSVSETSFVDNENIIKIQGQYVNLENEMFKVINNHDGTLTIEDKKLKVDGSFKIENSNWSNYFLAYIFWDSSFSKPLNSWFNSEQDYPVYTQKQFVNEYSSSEKIKISEFRNNYSADKLLYTELSVGRYDVDKAKFYRAISQEVRNPVKITYNSQGGTVTKPTDWLWDTEEDNKRFSTNIPTKKGSEFLGWYTSQETDASKITNVAGVVSISDQNKSNAITLYAHWKDHVHSWKYVTDANNKNILKAYCSNNDIPCDYYSTSGEFAAAPVTLKLQLNGIENGCISYSGSAYNSAEIVGKNDFVSLTGKTITGPTYYAKKGDANYMEDAPMNPGTYTVKVAVGDSSDQKQYELTADFEITKANINSASGVTMNDWIYGSYDSKINVPSLADAEKTNPGNGDVTYSYYTNESYTEDAKTSEANGAAQTGGVPKNAGTYYVKAEIPETDNYNPGTATGYFTIKPRTVELKWSDPEFTYDGTEHEITAEVKNVLQGDELNLTYKDNKERNAGNYTAEVTDLGNSNYSFSTENGKPANSHEWNIKPKAIKVIPDNLSKQIGRSDPEFTYKVTGLVGDDKLSGINLIRDPGESAGTYQISVTADENANPNYDINTTAKGALTIYYPSYPVTGIRVSPESITLTKKDETAQLTAEVTPSYADNKKVTWKSSDEKVATVDENGKVTAVGNGTATVTATTVSGSYTATVSVTVKIPVEIEKLTIEAEKETLTQIGETTELKVKIEPENADEQKLIWKSDNEMVAAVDENGKVTAVGNGTATITVTTEDGKVTASVTITVKIPEKPVINKTTGFGRLRARSAKQTKTSVTLQWNRLNDVDGYLIYGNRCNGNGKTYKYKKLATITSGKTQTWVQKGLKKGTFYKYVVKAYKLVDGKKVVTDISTSVHTVTQGGAYGIAKSVSVTKIGNKKNTLGVTLKKGQKAQITAKEVEKDNKIKHHRNLCYESSNTEVATVTSKGLIQAKGKGTCKIWVYAQNGVYKELTITVK